MDCNRHSDTTESADCGQIFGSVLERPKGKTRAMDAGLVGQATACAKCIRSTPRIPCIRAIHSRKPCQKRTVASSWRRTGHAVPARCISAVLTSATNGRRRPTPTSAGTAANRTAGMLQRTLLQRRRRDVLQRTWSTTPTLAVTALG